MAELTSPLTGRSRYSSSSTTTNTIGVARNLSWEGAHCWICQIFPGGRIKALKAPLGRVYGGGIPLPTREGVWGGGFDLKMVNFGVF